MIYLGYELRHQLDDSPTIRNGPETTVCITTWLVTGGDHHDQLRGGTTTIQPVFTDHELTLVTNHSQTHKSWLSGKH